MSRWYAAYPYVGPKRPDTVAEQVTALVRNNDLGQVLPLVRFERGAKGQFYVFLAVESETPGELPPQLSELREHPILQRLLPGDGGARFASFDLDKIKTMVGGEISVQDYARRLSRPLLEPPVFADPFPPDDGANDAAADALLAQNQRYDRLLVWLSAAGSGSLTVALRACQALVQDQATCSGITR
jgi:hypothetical protein